MERKEKYKCTFSTIKLHERLQKVINGNGKYHGKIFNIKVTSVYLPLIRHWYDSTIRIRWNLTSPEILENNTIEFFDKMKFSI